ncbi:hypothetical protein FOI68_18060 [Brevibacillus sp. LEMMJ03]|uniref:hypothetical protein n=1 Tax=Brevibacillus sp. LEMMJ03 TaxID=2595056 RepID=UPI0005D0F7E0|nr:hypothetical protein [Brevibacillus sp. LEMMJ03]TRY24143.1 hypothetical protein FOI68_18060 [Brevibacillus sp. LEMMJ03]
MEDALLLLSLDDFFALLALFAGCFPSVLYIRRLQGPQTVTIGWRQDDSYEPSINPCLVETYPMAARQPQRIRLHRRVQREDGDSDASALRFSL